MKTRRMPCEGGGRDWSDVSLGQGMPRIAGHHWKLGEKHGIDSSSEPSEGIHPNNILVSDF